jgi:hypothetical protein
MTIQDLMDILVAYDRTLEVRWQEQEIRYVYTESWNGCPPRLVLDNSYPLSGPAFLGLPEVEIRYAATKGRKGK